MLWHNTLAHRATRAGLAITMLLLVPGMAWAACTLSVGGLNFGSYDVFSTSHTDSTGTLDVSCDTATSYTLTLSPGYGSYSQRSMVSGNHTLNYQLYSDAARTLVWGDGSGGSVTVVGNTDSSTQHAVYGRLPARQNVREGAYADSIVVTIEY